MMSTLKSIPVGVSARHIHVSREDLDVLYGKGYELTPMKDLSQPGQYAANETLEISTDKDKMKVRILGPVRKQTQIELALTDAVKLGLKPPVRDSGDLKGSPGLKVKGPNGEVKIDQGVIAACRHIHMTPADAAEYGVKDKEIVKVVCGGDRGLIFDHVLVRVHDSYSLEMHIDTDEGNASMLNTGAQVHIVK
jgi:putative phosphotransacetylase